VAGYFRIAWQNISEYSHTWQLAISDLLPGRYLVKAVHAPWGCENWIDAQAVSEQAIDVYKEKWPETYNLSNVKLTLDFYLQALLAHWYRPQLVQLPLPTPSRLTANEIIRFVYWLKIVGSLNNEQVIRNGHGLHNIFITNPIATTKAYLLSQDQSHSDFYHRVFPSPEVITLELEEDDRLFLQDIAYHFTDRNQLGAARVIKSQIKRRALKGVLATWYKNLQNKFPPLYDIIFLCEKYKIFSDLSSVKEDEYEKIKLKFQKGESL